MQKRILIVGERPVAEHNLGGHKGNESNDWSFQCVRTSLEAMAALRQAEYTAVVADARLAGGVSGGPFWMRPFASSHNVCASFAPT